MRYEVLMSNFLRCWWADYFLPWDRAMQCFPLSPVFMLSYASGKGPYFMGFSARKQISAFPKISNHSFWTIIEHGTCKDQPACGHTGGTAFV